MWVSHSLEQGDIGRILEPLLLLLLHPSTARVSHYYSKRESMNDEDKETDKVGEYEEEDGECEGVKEDVEDVEQEQESVECTSFQEPVESTFIMIIINHHHNHHHDHRYHYHDHQYYHHHH